MGEDHAGFYNKDYSIIFYTEPSVSDFSVIDETKPTSDIINITALNILNSSFQNVAMKLSGTGYSFSESLKKFEKQLGFQTEIKWNNVIFFTVFHAFGIYWSCLHAFPAKWQTLVFAWLMYLANGTGLIIAVHRHWAHKCFKATVPLKIYFMLCFASAGQNSIYNWVRDHRLHHKYSDTDADPHNINRGFFFAHIGWLMMKKKNLLVEKGLQIDMTDILQDPVAMFEHRYSNLLSIVLCFVLPTISGVVLWGETWQCAVAWQCFIRFLIVFHLEMSINSFAHTFGNRPFNKNISPTQNIFLALFTVGEGGHNYHHTYPSDYRSAEALDFLNFPTFTVKLLAKLGLVYDIKVPNDPRAKVKQEELDVQESNELEKIDEALLKTN